MLNKKGQGFDVARKTIYWILASILISVVVLAFAFGIAGYREKITRTPPELPAALIALRFTNIEECFAVIDSNTKAVITGTVDLQKFNEDTLLKCYATEQEQGFRTFNFRLKLVNSDKEIITNNYFNRDNPKLTLMKEVLVKKDQGWLKDQLIVYVQENTRIR